MLVLSYLYTGASSISPSSNFSRLPVHTHVASFAHDSLSTRQSAEAFNKPLSIDTSSVTDMNDMFRVRRFAHAVSPAALFLMTLLRFGSAQEASAFNQPLTLDTSSVTDMSSMFSVRSTPMPYTARSTPSFSAHMPPSFS